MFEVVMLILFILVFVAYVIFELYMQKRKSSSYKEVQPLHKDKWVYSPERGVFLVKGDFWIGHDPKSDKPYEIVNADVILYKLETLDDAESVLVELASFMNSDRSVYFLGIYPKGWCNE